MFFLSQSAHSLIHNHEVLLGLKNIILNQAHNALLMQYTEQATPSMNFDQPRIIIDNLIFSRSFSTNINIFYFDSTNTKLPVKPFALLDFCQKANLLNDNYIITFNRHGFSTHPYDPIMEKELVDKYWNKDIFISGDFFSCSNQNTMYNLIRTLNEPVGIEIMEMDNKITQIITNNKSEWLADPCGYYWIEVVDQNHINIYAPESIIPYLIHTAAFFKFIDLAIEYDIDERCYYDSLDYTVIIDDQESKIEINRQRE
jgi:hypothetical protein